MADRDALKSIFRESLGEIAKLNNPGVVGPDPEVALKVYGVEKPATDSVKEPAADPEVPIENLALFLLLPFAVFVEDVFVSVIWACAVLVAVEVMNPPLTTWQSISQSPTVNDTIKLLTPAPKKFVLLFPMQEPPRAKASGVLRNRLVMASPSSEIDVCPISNQDNAGMRANTSHQCNFGKRGYPLGVYYCCQRRLYTAMSPPKNSEYKAESGSNLFRNIDFLQLLSRTRWKAPRRLRGWLVESPLRAGYASGFCIYKISISDC
jgi:hypothetical protein